MNKLNIRKQIVQARNYLLESKYYIIFGLSVFIFGSLIGFFMYSKLGFLNELLNSLKDQTFGLDLTSLIFFILINNIQASFFAMVLGVALGIFPFITSLSNGVVLGYVLRKVFDISGTSEFWRILPHGIFELPAVFISIGLGMKLGLFSFDKGWKVDLSEKFYNSINVFLFVVLPLLMVAAIIEGILIIYFG